MTGNERIGFWFIVASMVPFTVGGIWPSVEGNVIGGGIGLIVALIGVGFVESSK